MFQTQNRASHMLQFSRSVVCIGEWRGYDCRCYEPCVVLIGEVLCSRFWSDRLPLTVTIHEIGITLFESPPELSWRAPDDLFPLQFEEMPRSKLEPWGFFLAHVLRNGRYSKNCENFFKNIIVFCPLPRAKIWKIRFFRKMLILLLQFFIFNCLTAMQYTVGKNALNGREWDITCHYVFLFGKVIKFWTFSMFRIILRKQKQLKISNFFIPRTTLKRYMSIASVFFSPF